mmetsp:Transcript_123309/g.230525  ORF Transcript_123309/g.230525 Transcript_123309/m.230525 type:complete len:87 (-) Transcript_123309:444-704(-)
MLPYCKAYMGLLPTYAAKAQRISMHPALKEDTTDTRDTFNLTLQSPPSPRRNKSHDHHTLKMLCPKHQDLLGPTESQQNTVGRQQE